MTTTLLLGPVFDTGEKVVGPILTYTFLLLMFIELVYVFIKYVLTTNK
ncbi:MAG: hypothetical protein JST06_07460 [Bacteroidetes bacterium]|nr:hypothetical protein [Bacteroidota bacterium]MBS1629016.1 hypothetical protein [Bacteroidota bacterium]